MRDHRSWLCAAIVLACMPLMFCAGCLDHYPCQTSPLGINVVDVDRIGYSADLARIDAEWIEMAACNGYAGSTLPTVYIRRPDMCPGGECYECQSSSTGWCHGETFRASGVVVATPNLAALSHEYSHLACMLAGGSVEYCGNFVGRCGL